MGPLQATNENNHGKIPLTAYLLARFLVNEEHLSYSLTTDFHYICTSMCVNTITLL